MEEIKKQRGGKREGAGRKPIGIGTTPMSLKLQTDLYNILNEKSIVKNSFINDAVREKLIRDGFI